MVEVKSMQDIINKAVGQLKRYIENKQHSEAKQKFEEVYIEHRSFTYQQAISLIADIHKLAAYYIKEANNLSEAEAIYAKIFKAEWPGFSHEDIIKMHLDAADNYMQGNALDFALNEYFAALKLAEGKNLKQLIANISEKIDVLEHRIEDKIFKHCINELKSHPVEVNSEILFEHSMKEIFPFIDKLVNKQQWQNVDLYYQAIEKKIFSLYDYFDGQLHKAKQKSIHDFSKQADNIVALANQVKQHRQYQLARKFYRLILDQRQYHAKDYATNHVQAALVDIDDLIEKGTHIKNENAVSISQWRNYRIQLHEFRTSLRNATKENFRDKQIEFSINIKKLIATIIAGCHEKLGPMPCEFSFLVMGSMARLQMCGYSDLDIALLVEEEKFRHHPSFQAIIQQLKSKVDLLGEKDGLHIDDGDMGHFTSQDKDLINTPDGLVKRFNPKTVHPGSPEPYSIHRAAPLYTSKNGGALYDKFTELLAQEFAYNLPLTEKPRYRELGLLYLKEHARQFQEEKAYHEKKTIFNLKKCFSSQIVLWCTDLALFVGCKEIELPKVFKFFNENHVLLPEFVSLLWQILNELDLFRTEITNVSKSQREIVTSNTKSKVPPNEIHNVISEERFIRLKLILKYIIEPVYHSVNLLTMNTVINSFNPIAAVIENNFKTYLNSSVDMSNHNYIKLLNETVEHLLFIKNLDILHLSVNVLNSLFKQAVTHYSNHADIQSVLKILLISGAEIDAVDGNTQQTLLEAMMQQNKIDSFLLLVKLGAGSAVEAKKLFDFFKKYNSQIEWKQKFMEASKILSKQNSRFSWLLLMDIITQDTPAPGTQLIEGSRSGKRYLKSEVCEQIFSQGTVKRANTYGRRAVACAELAEQKVWLKFYPEMPLFEEAVRLLMYKLFTTSVITETELFSFKDKSGKSYPVLFSQNVEGTNFQKVIDVVKNEQELAKLDHLDHGSFSQLFLLTLLINSEDGKPDNYILSPFFNAKGEQVFRLVGIDNDHSFVEPVVKEKDHRVLQIKTVVYCIDHMLKPLDKKTVKAFLEINPAVVIEKWLAELSALQDRYDQFFSEDDRIRLIDHAFEEMQGDKTIKIDNQVITRILFKRGIISKIYENLVTAQKVLREKPNITALRLLRVVIPLLGIPYEEAFKLENSDPNARFRFLFKHQYSTIAADRYGTITTGKQILASAEIMPKDIYTNKIEYGPKQAINELKTALQQENTIDTVKKSLLSGDITPFSQLYLDNVREAVLKSLEIHKLDSSIQAAIFKALEKISSIKLNLSKCLNIKLDNLKKIIEHSPSLLELDISYCDRVTDELIPVIAKNCKILLKLDLSSLPKLEKLMGDKKPLELLSLKRLWLNNSAVKEVYLKAPNLKSLEINNSVQLVAINFIGHNLESLAVENSLKLSEFFTDRLISQSPILLKNLHIKGIKIPTGNKLLRYCSYYKNDIFTKANVQRVIQDGKLQLQGSRLHGTQLIDLLTINETPSSIKEVHAEGSAAIDYHALIHCITAGQANIDDYSSTKITVVDYAAFSNESSLSIGKISGVSEIFSDPQTGHLFVAIKDKKDKSVRQFDLNTTQECQIYKGHDEPVVRMTIRPNGDLVTASNDKSIRVWNRSTGECVKKLDNGSMITGLESWGTKLINVSHDQNIKIWDVDNETDTQKYKSFFNSLRGAKPNGEILALELYDKDKLITGTQDGSVNIWHIPTGQLLKNFVAHELPKSSTTKKEMNAIPVTSVKVIGKNKIATASADHTIKIWNIDWARDIIRCLFTLEAHASAVKGLLVLEHERLLLSYGTDGKIKIWNLFTKSCIQEFSGHSKQINSVCMLDDGRLISADDEGIIKAYTFKKKVIDLSFIKSIKTNIKLDEDEKSISVLLFGENNQELVKAIITFLETTLGKFTDLVDVKENKIIIKKTFSQLHELALKLVLQAISEKARRIDAMNKIGNQSSTKSQSPSISNLHMLKQAAEQRSSPTINRQQPYNVRETLPGNTIFTQEKSSSAPDVKETKLATENKPAAPGTKRK